MATFVHLTSIKNVRSIRRSGIRMSTGNPARVFASPVVPNFYISHQWLRELKKWNGARTLCGVYFRIEDAERVSLGHYRQEPIEVTASEAVGIVMQQIAAEGYQVLIPRKIQAPEIQSVRILPQVLGWRHFPGAHGKQPCGCPVCQPRGEPYSGRIRSAWETANAVE